jgi:hypothetical protein
MSYMNTQVLNVFEYNEDKNNLLENDYFESWDSMCVLEFEVRKVYKMGRETSSGSRILIKNLEKLLRWV